MSIEKHLQILRNNEQSKVTDYIPIIAEPIFDTERKQLRIGDGVTPGGIIPSEFSNSEVLVGGEHKLERGNEVVLADVRTTPIVIELPNDENVSTAQTVKVLDLYSSASEESSITVRPAQGTYINGVAEGFEIDLPRSYITFVYIKESKNWLVDLGGTIVPTPSFELTDELEWTENDQLGIKSVAVGKLDFTKGPLDLGAF